MVVALAPFSSDAQSVPGMTGTIIVVGVVRDTLGNPLKGAEIYTLGGRRTYSDEKGEFYLDNIPAGSVHLIFRRIGYLPATIGFDSEPGLKVSVAAKMVSTAQVLSTIVVEGKSLAWRLYKVGFYERQAEKRGFFITPEQLANTDRSLSSLFGRFPGSGFSHPAECKQSRCKTRTAVGPVHFQS